MPDLSDDEVLARLHFRVGVRGRAGGVTTRPPAGTSSAPASCAPMDFTVRRAAMPLLGGDPFGPEFMELFAEWQAAGSPFHGLPPMTADS